MSRPHRIGLVMQGGTGWIGGSEYIANLVFAWATLPAETRSRYELCLISGQPLSEPLRQRLDPFLARQYVLSRDLPTATAPRRARWLADQHLRGRPNTRFAQFIKAEKFDLLYPLTYDNRSNIGVNWPLGNALGSCRWLGWIPDLQHRFLPELFSERELASRDAGVEILACDAPAIVFSSQCALADFRAFYPAAKARLELLHFCTSPNPEWFEGDPVAIQRRFHLPDRFILVSNQFWQHKNHAVVFEAIGLLRERGVKVNVVCTGQTFDNRRRDYFNSLLRQIHESGIAAQIFLLGLVERAEQIQLMRRSLAVVQPSLFEGWSTVLEDARALGKTVVASDIGVHQEQNLPGIHFFERSFAKSLAAVLEVTLPDLQPGPNLDREIEARKNFEGAVPEFGQRFLEIVERGLAAK